MRFELRYVLLGLFGKFNPSDTLQWLCLWQFHCTWVAVHTANGAAYFNHITNGVIGLAERTYVVNWDAVRAAALITFEEP